MMIRFATLRDNIHDLARLVYETDTIIPFLFGGADKAIQRIKELIEREDNVFSYKNIVVYEDDNQSIKGIILFYAPQQKNKKRENEDYSQVFTSFELLKLWFKTLILHSIDNKSEIDGIYIQNISVKASSRGEGIGTQLINHTKEWAREHGYTSLWLDVAFENHKAKKLYENHGFSEVSKHRILLSKSGFSRMKKNLPVLF